MKAKRRIRWEKVTRDIVEPRKVSLKNWHLSLRPDIQVEFSQAKIILRKDSSGRENRMYKRNNVWGWTERPCGQSSEGREGLTGESGETDGPRWLPGLSRNIAKEFRKIDILSYSSEVLWGQVWRTGKGHMSIRDTPLQFRFILLKMMKYC